MEHATKENERARSRNKREKQGGKEGTRKLRRSVNGTRTRTLTRGVFIPVLRHPAPPQSRRSESLSPRRYALPPPTCSTHDGAPGHTDDPNPILGTYSCSPAAPSSALFVLSELFLSHCMVRDAPSPRRLRGSERVFSTSGTYRQTLLT